MRVSWGWVRRAGRERAAVGLALALILSAGPAGGQEDPGPAREEQIEITDRAVAAIRLLLEEFAARPGVTAEDADAVFGAVSTDLDYSDLFRITTMSRRPEGEDLGGRREQFLVRGEVSLTDGSLLLRGSLPTRSGRSCT